MEASLLSIWPLPSPIPSGGLEIMLKAKLAIDEKHAQKAQISPTTNHGKLWTKYWYWNWWNWHWVRHNRSTAWRRTKWHQESHFHWWWHEQQRRIVCAYSFIFKCSVCKYSIENFGCLNFWMQKVLGVIIFGSFEHPKFIMSEIFWK